MSKKGQNEGQGRKKPALFALVISLMMVVFLNPNFLGIPNQPLRYVDTHAIPYVKSGQDTPPIAYNEPNRGVFHPPYPAINLVQRYLNESLSSQRGFSVELKIESNRIQSGQNITLIPTLIKTRRVDDARSPSLYIFIIDPTGVVKGAFPSGIVPAPSEVFNPLFPLSASGIYLPYDQSQLYSQGLLAFTFRVPENGFSVGLWRVVVIFSDSTIDKGPQPIAGISKDIEVIPKRDDSFFRPIANFVTTATGMFGVGSVVYKIAIKMQGRVDRIRRELQEDKLFLYGMVSLLIALILIYFRVGV